MLAWRQILVVISILFVILCFTAPFLLAFSVAQPENALASAFLIFSFVGTAVSFLAFAILAEKRNISTKIRGKKAFYYLGGLTEGAETILLLLAMVTWPNYFSVMAFWICTFMLGYNYDAHLCCIQSIL